MTTNIGDSTVTGDSCRADEKVKHDPVAFRDSLLRGFSEAGEDLDALSKYLDTAGNKLDYKHYGETLFDVLIAGGILGEYLPVLYGRGEVLKLRSAIDVPFRFPVSGPDMRPDTANWTRRVSLIDKSGHV